MWAVFHAFHVAYHRRISCSVCITASLLWRISYSCNDQPCLYSGNGQVCIYGESVHVVIMDGLHLEMAIWNILDDLEGFDWVTILVKAIGMGSGGTYTPKFYNLSIKNLILPYKSTLCGPPRLECFPMHACSWLKQRWLFWYINFYNFLKIAHLTWARNSTKQSP